ncbi:MAG: major capsid protein, partial [Pyrinomonadaceae bacterium]
MVPKSVFDLTHEKTLSCDMGKLVPIMCLEAFPGDEFAAKTDILLRLAPMLAPMMHRVNVYTHYMFVPSRTLMTDWEKFITGGEDGKDATVFPTIKAPAGTGWALNSLADYLGLPTGVALFESNALPFRAVAKCFNDWFRNQNLVTALVMSMGNGLDTTTSTALPDRAWEQDRLTSALPFAQRGDPVTVPLGGTVPVTLVPFGTNANPMKVRLASNDSIMSDGNNLKSDPGGVTGYVENAATNAQLVIDPNGRLTANLGSASPITINALRQVVLLQQWLEKNARSGARYVENLLEHWGVHSSDARLQRAEYLGGGVSPITVSEVLQTSATGATGTPLGAMAGHGFSVPSIHAFKKRIEEHGYVLCFMSVLPRTKYQQGSAPMWNRRSRYDFPLPMFSGLGEQAVLKKEVYAGSADPNGTFGYCPRFQEVREEPSTTHGDFKSSMNYWTMTRIFG